MTVKNTNTATEAGLLISYYIALSFWAAQTLAMSMITRNVAGQTKKSVVIAFNFLCWSGGNAAGRFLLLISMIPLMLLSKAPKCSWHGMLQDTSSLSQRILAAIVCSCW